MRSTLTSAPKARKPCGKASPESTTDRVEQELLNQNIALNSTSIAASGGSAVAFPLIWGETDCSTLQRIWASPDIVVAADVIYHRELMTPLLSTAEALGV